MMLRQNLLFLGLKKEAIVELSSKTLNDSKIDDDPGSKIFGELMFDIASMYFFC